MQFIKSEAKWEFQEKRGYQLGEEHVLRTRENCRGTYHGISRDDNWRTSKSKGELGYCSDNRSRSFISQIRKIRSHYIW